MRFGQILKTFREQHRMSIRAFAEAIGIPWPTYAGIERGRSMQAGTLLKILGWMLEERK